MRQEYFQTGDVLYFQAEGVPPTAKAIKGNLIHKGQTHEHLIEGEFELLIDGEDLFIRASEPCRLTHGEHKAIELPAGVYKKRVVMEYDHWLEESRQVID